ncbi:MAG: hypothetical protein H6851_09930 [Geminicoccaceae bacterium]|nr:hypothetical protein [Geminicoccaceae bacterium]MCB9943924.1 hypothetical protein [Geminicoccaceae bacterium]
MQLNLVMAAIAAMVLVALLARDTDAEGMGIGRYQIAGTDGNIWRVDTVTGAMRTCFRVNRNGTIFFRCMDVK